MSFSAILIMLPSSERVDKSCSVDSVFEESCQIYLKQLHLRSFKILLRRELLDKTPAHEYLHILDHVMG